MVANFKNIYYVWLINTTQSQLSTATQKQTAFLNKTVKTEYIYKMTEIFRKNNLKIT